jgi:glutathione S-transferase
MGNSKSSDNKITLGYWGVQGTGQCIRYLLAIVGANWEDKIYMDPK